MALVDLTQEQQQQQQQQQKQMMMAMMMPMAAGSCVVSANTSFSLANVARVQEMAAKAAVSVSVPLQ